MENKLVRVLSLFAFLAAACESSPPTTPTDPNMMQVDPSDVFDELPTGIAVREGALSVPTTPQFVRFVDSYAWTDGTSNYRTAGAAVLYTDGNMYIQAMGTSGPRNNKLSWTCFTCGQSSGTASAQAYGTGYTCAAANPTWTDIGPYLDSGTLRICVSGTDSTCATFGCPGSYCGAYSGIYTPLGDGSLTNAQGGGVRAGFQMQDSNQNWWVLTKKTSGQWGGTFCACSTNSAGPGNNGAWIILPLSF